ncbi:DUF3389 domain-containing protein [Vibrio tritonius]|uniref:DUF3389 domain-containing protein n=1 Tax=Vibrio tritonius TaxID=1435069 RepID=UPI00315D890C
MLIEFSQGKIIVTPHEIVVKLSSLPQCVLQAEQSAVSLFGAGANVMMANVGGVKWSLKLDSEEQIQTIAQELGCEIA